jgi:hypothetical protein
MARRIILVHDPNLSQKDGMVVFFNNNDANLWRGL